MSWCTYILECADSSYYVGHSHKLPERVITHNKGQGPQFTAVRLPATLAYSEEHTTEAGAIKRERQIKRWSRSKKKALIDNDLQRLRALAKSRD